MQAFISFDFGLKVPDYFTPFTLLMSNVDWERLAVS